MRGLPLSRVWPLKWSCFRAHSWNSHLRASNHWQLPSASRTATRLYSGRVPAAIQLLRKSPLRSTLVIRKVSPSVKVATAIGLLAGGCSLCKHRMRTMLTVAPTAFCHVPQDCDSPELQESSPETLPTLTEFSLLQQICLVVRLAYLSILFLPAGVLYLLSYLFKSSYLADLGWRYTLHAIQLAGPAFIKLGQWASTRRDLFSEEFCTSLSPLHTRCDPHPWNETKKIMEENFGMEWNEDLVIVDLNPIGSGCVAQVYKGYLNADSLRSGDTNAGPHNQWTAPRRDLSFSVASSSHSFQATELEPAIVAKNSHSNPSSLEGRRFIPTAVKVLHPGIVEAIDRDIRLMTCVASWVSSVYPDVYWVAPQECVEEFAKVMHQQLDLKLEADNLQRFQQLLRDCGDVKFPTPIQPYVTSSVLVESFEPGIHISAFLDNPGGKLQKNLARIGIEVILDMLFVHNFYHGDLHPGNILVQDSCPESPKMVILDCGIASSLERRDLENFRAVFTAIVKGEGTKVADLFLGSQHCETVEEYRKNMAELVETAILRLNLKETQIGTLFSRLFNILLQHKVRIEPSYTMVMVAMMVIEGLGRSLDPTLDILATAKPCLLRTIVRKNLRIGSS